MHQMNYYDILEVSQNASQEVIKAAYKSIIQRYHPDKHPDNVGIAERASLIVQAYEVLSDPNKRAAYDFNLKQQIAVNFNNTSGSSRARSAPSASAKNARAYWFIWLIIALIVSSGWLILSLSKNNQSPELELMEIRSSIEGKQLTQKQLQEKFNRMNEIFRNHPELWIKEKNEREREISARTVPMFITDLTVHLKASIQSPESSGHELYIPIVDAVVGTFDSEKVIQHMEINKELIIKKVAEKLVDANYESLVKINSKDYLKKIILDSIVETTGTSRFEDYPSSRTESPGRYGVVDVLFPNSFSVR